MHTTVKVLFLFMPLYIIDAFTTEEINLMVKGCMIGAVSASVRALIFQFKGVVHTFKVLIGGILLGVLVAYLLRNATLLPQSIHEIITAACAAFVDKTFPLFQRGWIKKVGTWVKKQTDEL